MARRIIVFQGYLFLKERPIISEVQCKPSINNREILIRWGKWEKVPLLLGILPIIRHPELGFVKYFSDICYILYNCREYHYLPYSVHHLDFERSCKACLLCL